MATQLNIKNDEARRLAERVAAATGQTITEAVTDSLRRRWREVELNQSLGDESQRERETAFYQMIAGSRTRWKGAMLSIDHADLLYDEDGLPR